jgi:hypothetical protein
MGSLPAAVAPLSPLAELVRGTDSHSDAEVGHHGLPTPMAMVSASSRVSWFSEQEIPPLHPNPKVARCGGVLQAVTINPRGSGRGLSWEDTSGQMPPPVDD